VEEAMLRAMARPAAPLHLQSWAFYRYIFFDVFSMTLIGLGLFKLGVFTLERPTRLYIALVVIGYGMGLTVNAFETWWSRSRWSWW
jgi:uncharacterized protein